MNAPETQTPLLNIQDLKCHFPVHKGLLSRVVGQLKAVDGINFAVSKGETFGLVGETACGKSTTARLVMGLIKPTAGSVLFRGEDLHRLKGPELKAARRQMQMVFQDPYSSLDPRMNMQQIIGEPMVVYNEGTRQERKEKVAELLQLVGLGNKHLKRYPHEFSGGERQRICIARALALHPELLVCDEPVSALDVSIQSQVLNLLMDLQQRLHLTYFFISHDLGVVRHICDRVAVMYLGKIVEIGQAAVLFKEALHPYTKALLSAVPNPDPEHRQERLLLRGEVPSPLNPPNGCHFHPRCPFCREECAKEEPKTKQVGSGHFVACHLYSLSAKIP